MKTTFMPKLKPGEWRSTPWPFNPEMAPTMECYVTKIPYGHLYLYHHLNDADQRFHYCVSCGPNSERSYSGFTEIADLELAKATAIAQERKHNGD